MLIIIVATTIIIITILYYCYCYCYYHCYCYVINFLFIQNATRVRAISFRLLLLYSADCLYSALPEQPALGSASPEAPEARRHEY